MQSQGHTEQPGGPAYPLAPGLLGSGGAQGSGRRCGQISAVMPLGGSPGMAEASLPASSDMAGGPCGVVWSDTLENTWLLKVDL